MRATRTETITTTITHHDRTCDGCGEAIKPRDGYYDQSEVRISASLGDVFPEDDHRAHVAYDVCVPCWKAKVLPALEALFGKPPAVLEREDL